MQKWEYLFVTFSNFDGNWVLSGITDPDLDAKLSGFNQEAIVAEELGDLGWEMVSYSPIVHAWTHKSSGLIEQKYPNLHQSTRIVFKRPKQTDPDAPITYAPSPWK